MFKPDVLEKIEILAQQARRSAVDGSYTLGRDEIRNLPGGSTDALAAVRSLPGVSSSPPVAASSSAVLRQASVFRYQYNADFSEKTPLSEYVPLPSVGIRGEI